MCSSFSIFWQHVSTGCLYCRGPAERPLGSFNFFQFLPPDVMCYIICHIIPYIICHIIPYTSQHNKVRCRLGPSPKYFMLGCSFSFYCRGRRWLFFSFCPRCYGVGHDVVPDDIACPISLGHVTSRSKNLLMLGMH